jgi:hypothetical protein
VPWYQTRRFNSGMGCPAMRLKLTTAVVAGLVIGGSGVSAQTDDDLRLLWQKGDLASMEQIARTGDRRAEA